MRSVPLRVLDRSTDRAALALGPLLSVQTDMLRHARLPFKSRHRWARNGAHASAALYELRAWRTGGRRDTTDAFATGRSWWAGDVLRDARVVRERGAGWTGHVRDAMIAVPSRVRRTGDLAHAHAIFAPRRRRACNCIGHTLPSTGVRSDRTNAASDTRTLRRRPRGARRATNFWRRCRNRSAATRAIANLSHQAHSSALLRKCRRARQRNPEDHGHTRERHRSSPAQ
jgi:hypothetical protein